MDRAFVYILRCADGSFYTGITRRSVEERLSEHNGGVLPGFYTASRLPVELLYSEAHLRYDEAVAAERRIKGWSRAKKLAYVRGDFERLSRLARRRGKSPPDDVRSFDSDAAHPAQDKDRRGQTRPD